MRTGLAVPPFIEKAYHHLVLGSTLKIHHAVLYCTKRLIAACSVENPHMGPPHVMGDQHYNIHI